MAMEARLTLRQTQRPVMTPMLQQAIHLLQLSHRGASGVLQKELEENPLLRGGAAGRRAGTGRRGAG